MKALILVVLLGFALGLAEAQSVERIAFDVCDDSTGACIIVVTDADGSNPVAMAEGVAPAWSADGSRMAFVRQGWGTCYDPDYWYSCEIGDVFVLDVGAGTVANLTNHPTDTWSPAWSPDGTKIAFASDRDAFYRGFRWGDLYVMNADGSGVRRLTQDVFSIERIAWSPDGGTITFTCWPLDALRICEINADGTGSIGLMGPPWSLDAAWSWDGAMLAFATLDFAPDGPSEIAVMNRDGSAVRRVTTGVGWAAQPTWSPGASRVAFSSDTNCEGDGTSRGVWVANVDGTGLACIGRGSDPAWMPGVLTRASAPPVVTHTAITDVRANAPIVVTATITDDVGVTAAILGYRRADGPYTTMAMTASGSSYTATIPAAMVTGPALEYYLEARDADGNITRTPALAPIVSQRVRVDTTPPTVTLSWYTRPVVSRPMKVSAVVTEDVGVASATFNYRIPGGGAFTTTPMPCPGFCIGTIPAEAMTTAGIEFYFEARDFVGQVGRMVPLTIRRPADGPGFSVSPSSGPPGTEFTIRVTGWTYGDWATIAPVGAPDTAAGPEVSVPSLPLGANSTKIWKVTLGTAGAYEARLFPDSRDVPLATSPSFSISD